MEPEAAAKGAFLAAGKTLAGLAAVYLIATDPRPLLVNWHKFDGLPFAVKGHVELATKSDPIKRASLSLVCADDGRMRLVLRAKLPERSALHLPDGGRATLFVDAASRLPGAEPKSRTVEMDRAELLALGVVDTLATTPLSAAQVQHLAAAFAPASRLRMSFLTMERAVYLTGATDAESIRTLVTGCPRT